MSSAVISTPRPASTTRPRAIAARTTAVRSTAVSPGLVDSICGELQQVVDRPDRSMGLVDQVVRETVHDIGIVLVHQGLRQDGHRTDGSLELVGDVGDEVGTHRVGSHALADVTDRRDRPTIRHRFCRHLEPRTRRPVEFDHPTDTSTRARLRDDRRQVIIEKEADVRSAVTIVPRRFDRPRRRTATRSRHRSRDGRPPQLSRPAMSSSIDDPRATATVDGVPTCPPCHADREFPLRRRPRSATAMGSMYQPGSSDLAAPAGEISFPLSAYGCVGSHPLAM